MINYDNRFSLANCIVSPLHYFTLSLKELAENMVHNVNTHALVAYIFTIQSNLRSYTL